MERDQKYGTKAIYCLRRNTEHTAGSCFVKQMIYLHLSKQISRKSLDEREPYSYRNLWSPRKINFCRTVYRIVVLSNVSINLKLSVSTVSKKKKKELCFLSVFLVHDYNKGYFKFIFLVLNLIKTLYDRHLKNTITLILFSKEPQKMASRDPSTLTFEAPLMNVATKCSRCCHPEIGIARLEHLEC